MLHLPRPGAIPMALANIVNGLISFCVPRWGHHAFTAALALAWLDVGIAMLCGWLVPFSMMVHQSHSMDKMTALWLMPVVPGVVAANMVGVVASSVHASATQVCSLVTVGYIMAGFSIPLALSILVLYYQVRVCVGGVDLLWGGRV